MQDTTITTWEDVFAEIRENLRKIEEGHGKGVQPVDEALSHGREQAELWRRIETRSRTIADACDELLRRNSSSLAAADAK